MKSSMIDRKQCVVCGSQDIEPLLHLPALPLIPGCVDADSGECPRQDLDIMYCKGCGLMFNESEGIQEVGLSPYPSSTAIRAKLEQDKQESCRQKTWQRSLKNRPHNTPRSGPCRPVAEPTNEDDSVRRDV